MDLELPNKITNFSIENKDVLHIQFSSLVYYSDQQPQRNKLLVFNGLHI